MSSLFSIGDDEIDFDDEEFLFQVCETASTNLSSNLKGKNTKCSLRNSSNLALQEKKVGSFSSSNGLRSPLNTLCNNVAYEETIVNDNNCIGSRSKVLNGKGLNSIPNGLSQLSTASSSSTLCQSPPSKRLAVEIHDPPNVSKFSSFSVFQRKKRIQDNLEKNTSSSRLGEIRNAPTEKMNFGLQVMKRNSIDIIGELQNDSELQEKNHSERRFVVSNDSELDLRASNKLSVIVNSDKKKAMVTVGNCNVNDKSEVCGDIGKQGGCRRNFCDAYNNSSSAQSMSYNDSRESINLEIQDNSMAMLISNKPNMLNINPNTPLRKPQNTPRARKFPGPAGILPKLSPNQNLNMLISPQPTRIHSPEVCKKAVPQISNEDEDFNQDPWVTMATEFNKEVPSSMRYTVFQALKKAALHELRRGKVPGLCVLVKSFSPTGSDASILLKDPTGEIHGTVHRKVLEEYPSQLTPGSGLILRQVSVFSPSSRKHYLNITPGNIVELYPPGAFAATNSQSLVTQLTQSFPTAHAKGISIDDEKLAGNESVAKYSNTVEELVSNTLDDQLLLDASDDDLLVLAAQSVADSGLDDHELQQESFDDLLQGLESEDDLLDEALLV